MSRVVILGATGSLGRHVVRQAIAANHDVSVVVHTPSKLPADVRPTVTVHQSDLNATSTSDLAAVLSGHDAAINTAGLVTEGQGFVDLIDRLVTGLEALSAGDSPVCRSRNDRLLRRRRIFDACQPGPRSANVSPPSRPGVAAWHARQGSVGCQRKNAS